MKKCTFFVSLLLLATTFAGCNSEKLYEASINYTIEDGVIVLSEPQRQEGQTSLLEFRAEPLDTVRVGFVGLGMRGPGAVERFTYIDGVAITALCDKYRERAEAPQQYLRDAGMPEATLYSGDEGYKELCQSDEVDLVYIATPWQMHVTIALYAMEHGKHVAIEVPCANTVAECWQLVDAAERNRVHCTILENCCYDHFELTTLYMAQQGLFGEIIHTEGAYIHNLEPYWQHYADNWRLEYNQAHNGDIYATHGIGPNCQALNIHRGDRLDYLVAMSTKSVNGTKLVKELMNEEECRQGDQINKVAPELGTTPDIENLNHHTFAPKGVVEAMMEQYKHPVQRQLVDGIPLEEYSKRVGGHGGMDFIMDYRLVYCLRHGLPLDMDVYDAAEWSSMGELTRISIENGSKPVRIPDFTRGEWNKIDGLTHYFAE